MAWSPLSTKHVVIAEPSKITDKTKQKEEENNPHRFHSEKFVIISNHASSSSRRAQRQRESKERRVKKTAKHEFHSKGEAHITHFGSGKNLIHTNAQLCSRTSFFFLRFFPRFGFFCCWSVTLLMFENDMFAGHRIQRKNFALNKFKRKNVSQFHWCDAQWVAGEGDLRKYSIWQRDRHTHTRVHSHQPHGLSRIVWNHFLMIDCWPQINDQTALTRPGQRKKKKKNRPKISSEMTWFTSKMKSNQLIIVESENGRRKAKMIYECATTCAATMLELQSINYCGKEWNALENAKPKWCQCLWRSSTVWWRIVFCDWIALSATYWLSTFEIIATINGRSVKCHWTHFGLWPKAIASDR